MTAATLKRPSKQSPDEDAALMLRVQDDDAGAFGELVSRFGPRIAGRFFHWMQDRQEAEDLAQEVFLRLYRARKRYRPTARFSTWLYHITQNVARNAIRRRKRHPCVSLGTIFGNREDHAGQPLLVDGCPSQRLETSELAGVVRTAVSGLGSRQRAALEMHQFQHRTYAEIADVMAMTPKAAKSLLYRARNQLREQLIPFMEH